MPPPRWPTRSVDILQISRRVLPRACVQHQRALGREPCQAKVVAGGCTPSVNRPLLKRFRQLSCLPTARRFIILRCHLIVLPKCSLSSVASGVLVVHTASSKPGYSSIGCTQLFALLRLGTASRALCVGRNLPCGPGDMLSIHPGRALRELTCSRSAAPARPSEAVVFVAYVSAAKMARTLRSECLLWRPSAA